jgi:DNA-binding beta-propeller fold protein YncE
MNKKLKRALVLVQAIAFLASVSSQLRADTGTCGGVTTTLPFTDVMSSPFFCQIAEAFFSGLTNGTSATTYSPSDSVTREQMAAFITRTQDSALRRGSDRALAKQWATPTNLPLTGRTAVGTTPELVESDGADLWVADAGSADVKRVRASDGRVLETWTGATGATGVLVARGRVYVTGNTNPGNLYVIDPSMTAGPVTTLSSSLDSSAFGITTDGTFIWTANFSGSVSRVNPDSGSTTNISTGFTDPVGILFDGANIWVTDNGDSMLKKLDSGGNIVQAIAVGSGPELPVFDGSNIWVPNFLGSSITVVRARDGMVLATLTGNPSNQPFQAAFDGQRILVTNIDGSLGNVTLWRAADLTSIGQFSSNSLTSPVGACSDGINFWVTIGGTTNRLARF